MSLARDSTDQRFITCDEAVTDMHVDQVTDTLDRFARRVGIVFNDVCIHYS
jgi:hypothetical protein